MIINMPNDRSIMCDMNGKLVIQEKNLGDLVLTEDWFGFIKKFFGVSSKASWPSKGLDRALRC